MRKSVRPVVRVFACALAAISLGARLRGPRRGGVVEAGVLVARVRACLMRIVSHPGAIHVSVTEPQRVLLRGAVLAWERGPLLRAVATVPGVRGVLDQLAVHESAEHLCALWDGRSPRMAPRLLGRWSAGTRLATAVAGGGLLWGGLARRGAWGVLSATAGSVLLLRSIWNRPLSEPGGAGERTATVRRTVCIRAPIEQVFGALCDCERLPQVLGNVRSVQRRSDGSTYWKIAGPLGESLEWSAVTTQFEGERLLAWRTLDSSPLQHSGLARLEREVEGTRLQLDVWYRPPAGRLAEALSQLLGADSTDVLDAGLLRLKSYLENNRAAPPPPPHAPQMH